jgi:hypothetical protein
MKKKRKTPNWQKYPGPYEVGRDDFGYVDVTTDGQGWANPALYRPFPYDLVLLDTGTTIRPGWWSGIDWDGYRLRPDEKVQAWKVKTDNDTIVFKKSNASAVALRTDAIHAPKKRNIERRY